MKKLAVAYHPQTPDKSDCMVACLKMVLDYYGVPCAFTEMSDHFTYNSVGLSMPQIGLYVIDKGLNAEITTLNPHLFSAKDVGKSETETAAKIAVRSFDDAEKETIRKDFESFMQKGGIVSARLPTKQEIIKAIDKDTPVIILLVSRLLHGYKDGYNFHANLIYGYDDTSFYLHDPEVPDLGGGSHCVDQDLVMYAMAVMGYADIDNASFMKITKN